MTSQLLENENDTKKDTKNVREFFMKNSSPEWKTFVTCSRCEGFTLSFGVFLKLDEKKIDEINDLMGSLPSKNIDNAIDECKALRQMLSNPDANYIQSLCEKWSNQYPELVFYALPCCWGNETELDFFVGFNIYPLLWTNRRHFIKDHRLISASDDFCMSGESKKKILNKYEKYPLYKAPDFLETEYIFDTYQNADTWKESLYLKNYDKISYWIPILNNIYEDVIVLRDGSLKKFLKENKNLFSEETNEPEFEWCFLPSDCASCS